MIRFDSADPKDGQIAASLSQLKPPSLGLSIKRVKKTFKSLNRTLDTLMQVCEDQELQVKEEQRLLYEQRML